MNKALNPKKAGGGGLLSPSNSKIVISQKIPPMTYPEKSWLFLKHSKRACVGLHKIGIPVKDKKLLYTYVFYEWSIEKNTDLFNRYPNIYLYIVLLYFVNMYYLLSRKYNVNTWIKDLERHD